MAASTGWRLFIAALLAIATVAPAHAQKALRGVALVIGQSAYEHIAALPNPANDAREMSKLLTDLGFDTRTVTDRDAQRLKRDLERFAEDAADADVAVLYYSGHGIEAGGENWLLPVETDDSSLETASQALVSLTWVVDELRRSVPVAIVLLDACRTSPFAPGTLLRTAPEMPGAPAGAGGLVAVRGAARIDAPAGRADNLGFVIGFAAEPGQAALDGAPGGNSPYASALLRHLAAMTGAEFGAVMRMVTEEVYLSTGTKQRPWVNESLRRQLYFGVAPDEAEGTEALITGERRQLLLTIAELPDINRLQVEQVALRDGVPLDALYGILRALGETAQPRSPEELATMLDAQAERLGEMLSQRAALRTDDPEVARLSEAADRAIEEGAIQTARLFMDQAVSRIEETGGEVDELEELLKRKRIADAAVYAKRGDALALAFEFRAAAQDYSRAFDLVEKWDDRLAWNYKDNEAEALRLHGQATGDRAALDGALDAYETLLRRVGSTDGDADRAIVTNNMAVVLNIIGERSEDSADLMKALAMFEEALTVFERLDDGTNWAAAKNNIGNINLALGGREASSERLELAIEAFREALEKRDRNTVPLDWAATQNNIGIATYALAARGEDPALLIGAEAAYRAALEVYTRGANPTEWAMTKNNLGNTLNAIGLQRNDPAYHEQAIEAYVAALEVRTRNDFPLQWAATQVNAGSAYSHLSRHDTGTENLELAKTAYESALEVLSRAETPLDWASAQNNLGAALQTIGQRNVDAGSLTASVEAFARAREVYRREGFPLDWAMTWHNAGNTLHLLGLVTGDPAHFRRAADAFREALGEHERGRVPMQWALTMHSLGGTLQASANSEVDTTDLRQAIEARRAALEVLTADNAPVDWANAQNGLGTCLLNLSTREQSAEHLPEAMAAFEAAQTVFTRDSQLLQWAFVENNIGDVHWNLASQGGGDAELRRAIEKFESARTGFGLAGHFGGYSLLEQKISLVRQSLGGE